MPAKADEQMNEKQALLHGLSPRDQEEIEKMQNVGAVESKFKGTVQLAVRGAVLMMVIGSILWVPAMRKPFPNELQSRLALVACLFVFTINPILGTAIQNGLAGILGTFWACLHMWVMNGIFPGGMKEGMSPTSATAIFGWVNFLVFLWLVLWSKCGIGLKMFALANDIGFMMAFLDPASTMVFSENFTISSQGTAVNTLIATLIACLLAPVMNLVPYPMTSAFSSMKTNAEEASRNTATLFAGLVTYYSGTQRSIVIEVEARRAAQFRASLDAMGGSIGAAWFEGFDLGTRGTVRVLMENHLALMNKIFDRLKALLSAVASEDFGASHEKIMTAISTSSEKVVGSANKLLLAVTKAAGDGSIDADEKATLQKLIDDTKAAVNELAVEFDKVRRTFGQPLSDDVLGESFFVVTISAYARLICEYSDIMIKEPPSGAGFGAAITGGLVGTWSGLMERFNLNFAIKHFVAIVFCWLWSVYVDGWTGACVITSVFLISGNVCPDIQGFLNVMIAVIFGVVVGTVIFTWSCASGIGDIIIPIVCFVLWSVGLYAWFGGSPLALPALLVVALTPFKLMTSCPLDGDIAAGRRGLWAGMVGNVLAIVFVASMQYFLAPASASGLATQKLEDAFSSMQDAFKAFWKKDDATAPMASVAGSLGDGVGFNGGAQIEPRFWRNNWQGSMYQTVAAQMQQVRLDILMLWYAAAGSDGVPDAIFEKMSGSSEFQSVQDDLNMTLSDARYLAISILKNESGSFDGLGQLKTTEGIDTLDALKPLQQEVNKLVKFPEKLEVTSMEDDEICQIATVFLTLGFTIQHIAAIIQTCIKAC